MKRFISKTILTLCIVIFLTIWYQVISKIACNFLCDPEVEEGVVDYESMSPEELAKAFKQLQAKRQSNEN